MVLFKQYRDLKILPFSKKKIKNQQAVFRMEVPFQLNKLCAVPVKPVVSPGAVQEP